MGPSFQSKPYASSLGKASREGVLAVSLLLPAYSPSVFPGHVAKGGACSLLCPHSQNVVDAINAG